MTLADFSTLVEDVKYAEGLRLTAYRDPVGVLTIGYGTNLEALTIDEPLASRLAIDKLTQSGREAERFPWYAGLSGARQRAIVELIYNMGLTKLMGFVKFLRAMASGDYGIAADELINSRWYQQVKPQRGDRIADLIRHG